MTLMHVSLVELLRYVAMGQIPTLDYMLSYTRGLLRLRPIMPGT
jgi:hypothetical protein